MSNAATITLANIQSRPAPRALTYPLPGRQGYNIVDLGTFNDPGGAAFDADSSVMPSDINNAGLVVGAEFLPTAGNVFAFSFTQTAGIVNLGPTITATGPGPINAKEGPGFNNLATGVNDAGQVAFMADRSNGGGGYMPARLAGGTLSVLPIFETPGYNQVTDAPTASYYTSGINGVGDVVGRAFVGPGLPTGQPTSQPFLIDSGGIRGLGNLGGLGGGGAMSINGAGEIVGYSQTPTTPTNDYWNPGHAFVYTKAKGLVDLNLMIGSGGSWELLQANHINARGEIVGFGTLNKVLRAFLFAYGVVLDLGTFPNGGISVATSINNRGEIVGYAYLDGSGEGNYRACVFSLGIGPMNLNNLIDPRLGWVLAQATGVNDVGQIVGWGSRQGAPGTRGFLMTPTR
jgi:probable HAF family extracellular repeat protein